MKILVCDDEPYFIEVIEKYCLKFEQENMIPIQLIKCRTDRELLAYCQKNKNIDIYILDIMLEKSNGLQIASKIRQMGIQAKIIFLTSAIKFAPQGYTVGASRYWMKPLQYEKFCLDILTIIRDIELEENSFILEETDGGIEKIYFDSIYFIETQGRKTCVHRRTANTLTKVTMAEYVKKLDNRFYRCHAAYIVNMDYIRKIKGLQIELKSGQTIYISKGKKENFLSAYTNYLAMDLFVNV